MKAICLRHLILLTIAAAIQSETLASRTEFIETFGQITLYDTHLESVTNFSQLATELSESLELDQNQIQNLGYSSNQHLLADVCLDKNRADRTALFSISNQLSSSLQIPKNQTYLSYEDLKPFKELITQHASIPPLSDPRFYPATNLELKRLNQKLLLYDAIQTPFELAPLTGSFSEKIESLITQLPIWLEAYQNQLEELPYNEAASFRFNKLLQVAKRKQRFHIFAASADRFETLESTLIESVENNIFPSELIKWSHLIDLYRKQDYRRATNELKDLIGLQPNPQTNNHKNKSPSLMVRTSASVLFVIASCSFLASIILKRRLFNLTYTVISLCWLLLFIWLSIEGLNSFTPPTLLTVTCAAVVFLIPAYRSKSNTHLILCLVFAIPTIVSTFIIPQEALLQLPTETYTKSLILSHNAYLVFSYLAVLTNIACISTVGSSYLKNRKTTDPFILKRQLTDKLKNHIHSQNLLILLCFLSFLSKNFPNTELTPLNNSSFIILISIICLNGVLLQLRWINQLNLSAISKYCWLSFFLSMAALFQLTGPLKKLYPDDMLVLSHPQISTLFIGCGLVGVLGSYLALTLQVLQKIKPSKHVRKN